MYDNILVPVLLDDDASARKSCLIARALANPGARFTVMHVLEQVPGFIAAEIPDDVLAKVQGAAEQALAQSAQSLPSAVTRLTRGHAGTSIVNFANENGIDCVVIASHKPGFEDFFLGSTAARVVRHAECSVHVIR